MQDSRLDGGFCRPSLALLYAFQSVGAQEKDNRNPLEAYKGDTFFHQVMCEGTLRLALARGDLYRPQDSSSDVQGCIVKGKTEAKASFNKALRTIRKPAAKEALKNYHVAFVTALAGCGNTQQPSPRPSGVMRYQRSTSTT
jgi:hypothetical protein